MAVGKIDLGDLDKSLLDKKRKLKLELFRQTAIDYFIKLINEKYETDFEAFYEGDTRLFTSVEENPDYDNCIDYANQNECDVEITDFPLLTKPEDLNI